MHFFTAGESHGKGLITYIYDFPRGVRIDENLIYNYLERRQKSGGRGARSKKEQIQFEIISGAYKGKTTGAPIVIFIPNKIASLEKLGPINSPRPGHIDLPAALKFLQTNSREFLERASARETAAKVTAGAFAKMLLAEFNIDVLGYTKAIGKIQIDNIPNDYNTIKENVLKSPFALPDDKKAKDIENLIKKIQQKKDTIGGIVEVIVTNLPPGIGNHNLPDKRLDAQLATAIFSIQAVKGLEIGEAILSSQLCGSEIFGNIVYDRKFPFLFRHTQDLMGGIEGGLSTGENIKLRIYIKPVPTMLNRKESVNLETLEKTKAHYESSDFCIVPSASVICEAITATVIADAFLERFGGIDIEETKENYLTYLKKFKKKYLH